MQKGTVVDLLDEEIRHVGTRDEPACPAVRIDQPAIRLRLWTVGQNHGTHDHPVELAWPELARKPLRPPAAHGHWPADCHPKQRLRPGLQPRCRGNSARNEWPSDPADQPRATADSR